VYNYEEAKVISSIPITRTDGEDRVIWPFSNSKE